MGRENATEYTRAKHVVEARKRDLDQDAIDVTPKSMPPTEE